MKTYANTLKESNQIAFDFEADYLSHLENLKSEISFSDNRHPDLSYDDQVELFLLLEFGEDEE